MQKKKNRIKLIPNFTRNKVTLNKYCKNCKMMKQIIKNKLKSTRKYNISKIIQICI